MKWAIAIALVGLLLITGCSQKKELPDWSSCNNWEICAKDKENVYNVSTTDCVVLNTAEAEAVFNIFLEHDIMIIATCVQQDTLIIRQIDTK